MKKIISLILSLTMLLSMTQIYVTADTDTVTQAETVTKIDQTFSGDEVTEKTENNTTDLSENTIETGVDDNSELSQPAGKATVNSSMLTADSGTYGTLADLGAEFYARIDCLHTNTNQYLALYGQGEDYSVIIYSNHDNDDKYWKFERYDDGSYKITNMYNINGKYKCLEVEDGAITAGTDAIVNTDDNGSDKQRWYIYSYNGNYVLKSACSECVLEVDSGKTANLANVQMGNFSGQTYQTFSIKKVTPPQESEITPVTSDAIKFQLFNYTTDTTNNINKIGGLQSNDFRKLSSYFCFLSSGYGSAEYQNNWKTYDDIDFNPNHATVERTLLNNYPVIDLMHNAKGELRGDGTNKGLTQEERSLAYLFGGESNNTAVQSYSPKNTILQTTVKDGVTHYYYSSRQNLLEAASANAVDYDIDSNEFRIRSYTDKNKNNNYEDSFLPFNSSYYNTEVKNDNNIHVITDPDYAFGMRMDVDFVQSAGGKLNNNQDMEFKFAGDDDIWVFIDDVLVLDLGGGHGPVTGSINFANGKVIASGYGNTYETTIYDCFDAVEKSDSVNTGGIFNDYTTHKLSLFYFERGGAGANCCMDFNMPTMPDGSLAVAKDVVSSSKADLNSDDTAEYTFRLSKVGGDITDTPELENITKNKKDGTMETVNGNATSVDGGDDYYEFTLQGGESIYFTKLDEEFTYKIEEITTGQTFIKSTASEIIGTDTGGVCNGKVVTVSPSKTDSKTVHFTNEVESLAVILKYYGRETVNGKPADIKKEPTTYTKYYVGQDYLNYVNDSTNSDYVGKMILDTGVAFDSASAQQDTKYKNVLDGYEMWISQTNAESGIKNKINLHTNSNYTDSTYHTNWYGYTQQLGDDGKWYWTDGENGTAKTEVADGQHEKWVTYYSYENGSKKEVGENGSNVTEVTIWLFNQPKQYTVEAYEAQSFTDLTEVNGKYVAKTNRTKDLKAYYNQRLGLEIDENAEYSQATNHLAGYGIDSYVGTKLETAYSVKDDSGNTYKFAYWAFDPDGKNIASTDILYNYRILTTTKLYAVYTSNGVVNDGNPGLTVSENERDIFFNSSGTSITRLNTEMNPYNCQNKDTNIKNVAIVYIIPSSTDSEFDLSAVQGTIKDTLNYLDDAESDKDFYSITYSEEGITLEGIKKGNYFVFYVDGHNIPEDELTGVKDISLTNKNRIEFGSDFKTSALNGKRMYAFGAMYYTNEWIVSDNFIDYNFTTTSTTAG